MSSLLTRRDQIAREIRRLKRELAALDTVIRIMEPEAGERRHAITRRILEALREEPLTTRQLGIKLGESQRSIRHAMDENRRRGLVSGSREAGGVMVWRVVERKGATASASHPCSIAELP